MSLFKCYESPLTFQLFGICITEEDVKVVHSLKKPSRIPGTIARRGKKLGMAFTKIKSALTLGTKYSKKAIKESQSGPSIRIPKKSVGFSPRKSITKGSIVTHRKNIRSKAGISSNKEPTEAESAKLANNEEALMKGDNINTNPEIDVTVASEDKENVEEGDTKQLEKVVVPIPTEISTEELQSEPPQNNANLVICEPNLKPLKSENKNTASHVKHVKARHSASAMSTTSDKSYATVSGDETENKQDNNKRSKLSLKHLYTTSKTSHGANVYRSDAVKSDRLLPRHRTRSLLLNSDDTEVKLLKKDSDGYSNPSRDIVMNITVKPKPVPLKVPRSPRQHSNSKSSVPHLPPIHDKPTKSPRLSRPSSASAKDKGNGSSIPKLPFLPGIKKSLDQTMKVTPPQQPKENVSFPPLVPDPPEQQIVTLIMPGKVRTFSKHYLRRNVGFEQNSYSKSKSGKQTAAALLSAKAGKAASNMISNLHVHPVTSRAQHIKSQSKISNYKRMYLPEQETVDDILQLLRTILFYKTTKQVLTIVTQEELKSIHTQQSLANIHRIAVKSIVKLTLPLSEISEQRKYPAKLQFSLENYKMRLDQLAQGISSLIVTSIISNRLSKEVFN